MENKSNVGANLQKGGVKKVGIGISLKKKNTEEKRHEPYLLPCGNEKEFCFNQIKRKNARFCKVWKKVIWATCRHHIETPNARWEER